MDINISMLKYFQTVCKFNSITKGASELNISQPSVSVAIKKLEEELKINLFIRKNNRLILTEEGSIILSKVNELLLTFDNFFNEVADLNEQFNNKVRIGVSSIMGTLISPTIYMEIAEHLPYINLEISEYTFQQCFEQLENNYIDIGIVLVHGQENRIPENYNYESFYETSICFCINKNHKIANKKLIKFEDIIDIPLTVLSNGTSHYEILMQLFKNTDVKPKISLQSLELMTITKFVENFNMGTFIYKDIYKNNPNIAVIPYEVPMNVKFCIVWDKNNYVTHAIRKVIKRLLKFDWSTLNP